MGLKNYKRIKGLVAATFTPFDKNGCVNLDVIPQYSDYMAEAGIQGVFVCGTSGESLSLTKEEREQIAETWIKAVNKRFRVIVHVGSNSQQEAIELAKHAGEKGADGIAMMAPTFFKPLNVDELVSYFEPVAAQAANTPFYYYHMPSMTGVALPVKDFLLKGAPKIPNLIGVKFTSNNFMEMLTCLNLSHGSFEILNGYDECLLCGLALGAEAAVGSTYNYMATTYQKMIHYFQVGDIDQARKMQLQSVNMVDIILRHGGGTRGGKAIMRLMGIDCGNCRPPFSPFTDSEYTELTHELKQMGVL